MLSTASSVGLIGASLTALSLMQSGPQEDLSGRSVQTESESSKASARRQTVLVVQEGLGKVVSFSTDDPLHRKVIAFVSNFGLLEVNHQIGTPGTTVSVLDVERGIERGKFNLPTRSAAPHGLKLRPPQHRELSPMPNRAARK